MASLELAAAAPPMVPPQRPNLSAEQKRLILGAAGEWIRAAVLGQAAVLPDASLAGAAAQPVAGVFVTLKRNRHLRSCTGGLLDHAVALGKALHEASVRTALDDVRFPPVSPTELVHLNLDVWVLFNPTPVRQHGEERVHAVTVGGKHGLVVARGGARGLLLPGVAVEHDWDSRQFLDQVCVKAGLHQTMWKDDATSLLTFEGESFGGPVLDASPDHCSYQALPPIQPEELATFARFCRQNIALLLSGATPNYYLFGASDGYLNGATLSVRRQQRSEPLIVSQFSMRPGVPLQSTLYSLAQSAAQALAAQGVAADDFDTFEIGLTVLHDPAMHGTVADPQLEGIDSAHRAVLVVEKSRVGLVFDAEAAPGQLIGTAAQQARVRHPTTAGVFSLEALSTDARVHVSTVPRPIAGPAVRQPGVAGRFYPADPRQLSSMVDNLLEGDQRPQPWPAAMVPHAGLIYSGHIAAAVLKRIEIPETVIVLGPKHTALGVDWAVAPHRTWSLPGQTLASDPELARELAQSIAGLELDAVAHQHEHAIEVELPLIARLAPKARVVGIALGSGDLANCRRFAEGLAKVVSSRSDRTLLLISSDMNHFATDSENRRLDEMALATLDRLDPEELYETVTENNISMCGVLPAVIVLETLKLLGQLQKSKRVGYATSAEVSGDTSRVVGYAGMLFGLVSLT